MDFKVLVIGAGGLGCEILKSLAYSGFNDIHIIDMDTIDVSNLNRQFLFREKDIGRSKAEVAAEFIMNRRPDVRVHPYCGKIQDKDEDYYMQFTLVIAGLDSVEARRWINALLVSLVDSENPMSIKPLIDGGTEGFKGQARVILPTINSCYECSLDMLPKQVTTYPLCTLANTPRIPEHCIQWASLLQWGHEHPDEALDGDDQKHVDWVFNTALQRAKDFSIAGVTKTLVQGVIKNIIPAIASTNSLIASACVNEAYKIRHEKEFLDNYMMYTGDEGVYTYTFQHEQNPECTVCGSATFKQMNVGGDWLVEDFIDYLKSDEHMKNPSIRSEDKAIYLQAPPQLEQSTRPNLVKKLSDVAPHGVLAITDSSLPHSLNVHLIYT